MMISILKIFAADERGSGTVMGLFLTLICITTMAFSIEFSNAWHVRTHIQVAADAAAMSAARHLNVDDLEQTLDRTMEIVELNLPSEIHGEAIRRDDIEFGVWEIDDATGEPMFRVSTVGSEIHAVRVVARRTHTRDNPIGFGLGTFFQQDGFQAAAESIALTGSAGGTTVTPPSPPTNVDGCGESVFMSRNHFHLGDDFSAVGLHCLYGHDHINTRGTDRFAQGARLIGPSSSDIDLSAMTSDSEALSDLVVRRGYDPVLVPELLSNFNTLWSNTDQPNGTVYNGDYITDVMETNATDAAAQFQIERVSGGMTVNNPSAVNEFTVYRITGDLSISLSGNQTFRNVVFIVDGNIDIEPGNTSSALTFEHVVFYARNDIDLLHNINFGAPAACGGDHYDTYLLAVGDIYWDQNSYYNSDVSGFFVAAHTFIARHVTFDMRGVYFEANDHLHFGDNTSVSACGVTLASNRPALDRFSPDLSISASDDDGVLLAGGDTGGSTDTGDTDDGVIFTGVRLAR